MRSVRGFQIALLAGTLAACGGDATGPKTSSSPAALDCRSTAPTQLASGAHLVFDPAASNGCLVLPAAGAGGAEHLVVALSTDGQVTGTGVTAPYLLSGQPGSAVVASVVGLQPSTAAEAPLSPAARFHDMLRARGRALAQGARPQLAVTRPPNLAVSSPPAQRSFQICANPDCSSFATVTAALKHQGTHGLVYEDTTAPANGYTQTDLDNLGSRFDDFFYPIDTTAFGRETDLDGNSAVIILLSPAVNRLSGNCNSTQSVILGFFFPDDLIPGSPGSNDGEIFYGLVPDPTNTLCTISRSFVLGAIGPTFLHEFQHMISFGRHVVLGRGAAEDNWLDEGLSRLAEELGGREVPDSACAPFTCMSEYPASDLANAFSYLDKNELEASALIEAGNVDGTLPQNGANWLFVRWLADHFASDSILGTSLTRALDGADSPTGTGLTGSINAATVTGVDFPTLVSEWQLANYLTSRTGFTEATGRLRYKSWNLPAAFAPQGSYPLQPDSLLTTAYSHTGVLQEGSGRHLRVIQAPFAPAVSVAFTSATGTSVSPTVVPRFGVARVR
jgi:hypothetical protein